MKLARHIFINLGDEGWESWTDPALRARSPVRWKLLFTPEHTPENEMTVGILEIPPGAMLLRHHHALQEIYYILDGIGTMQIDNHHFSIGPDTSVFIPPHAPHRTVNTGTTTLRFVFMLPTKRFNDIVYYFDE